MNNMYVYLDINIEDASTRNCGFLLFVLITVGVFVALF